MLINPPRMFSDCPVRSRLFSTCVEDGVPAWDTVRQPRGLFAWACHVEGLAFTYLYGSRASCARIRTLEGGVLLMKGVCDSLAEARALATARALETAATYEGVGSSAAVTALEFMQSRVGHDGRYRSEATRLMLEERMRER